MAKRRKNNKKTAPLLILLCAVFVILIAAVVVIVVTGLGGKSQDGSGNKETASESVQGESGSEDETDGETDGKESESETKKPAEMIVIAGDSQIEALDACGAVSLSAQTQFVYGYVGTLTFYDYDWFDNMSCMEKLQSLNPDRVYICLGLNDLEWRSIEDTVSSYETDINMLLEYKPDIDIIILATTPVGESQAASYDIPAYNEKVREMAERLGVDYFDWAEVVSLDSGFLNPVYDDGDGLHMKNDGYIALAQVLNAFDAAR